MYSLLTPPSPPLTPPPLHLSLPHLLHLRAPLVLVLELLLEPEQPLEQELELVLELVPQQLPVLLELLPLSAALCLLSRFRATVALKWLANRSRP